jgi:hypothetical protein
MKFSPSPRHAHTDFGALVPRHAAPGGDPGSAHSSGDVCGVVRRPNVVGQEGRQAIAAPTRGSAPRAPAVDVARGVGDEGSVSRQQCRCRLECGMGTRTKCAGAGWKGWGRRRLGCCGGRGGADVGFTRTLRVGGWSDQGTWLASPRSRHEFTAVERDRRRQGRGVGAPGAQESRQPRVVGCQVCHGS